jgi:RhoGAP domain
MYNKLTRSDLLSGMAPGEEKAQKFTSLFSQLPAANYDTLKALFTHLNK